MADSLRATDLRAPAVNSPLHFVCIIIYENAAMGTVRESILHLASNL